MPRMRSAVLCLPACLLAAGLTAQVTWTGAAGDGLWQTAGNWSVNRLPGPADNVQVNDSAIIELTEPVTIGQLRLGNGGDTIVLNVNATLLWSDTFAASKWGTSTDAVTVEVREGGVLGRAGSGANRIDGTATIRLHDGGLLRDLYRQREGLQIVLDGGTFDFVGASDGSLGNGYILDSGSVGGARGTIIFDALGSAQNDHIRTGSSAAASLNVSNLTLVVRLAAGYYPAANHTWDLFTIGTGSSGVLGDGSNVSTTDLAGLWQFGFDLREYTNLNKGIVKVTTASEIVPQSRPPLLTFPAGGTSVTLAAGQTLDWPVRASQVPADAAQATSLTATALPVGATFTPEVEPGPAPLERTLRWTPSLDQVGVTLIEFAAGDTDGTSTLTLRVTVTLPPDPAESFTTFLAAHFTPAERANPDLAGPGADPNRDGLANLFAYYLQRSPRQATPGELPMTIRHEDGKLVVRYRALARPGDLRTRWERTDALTGAWVAATPTLSSVPAEGAVAWHEAAFDDATGSTFVRLTLAMGEQLFNLDLPPSGLRYPNYAAIAHPASTAAYGEGVVALWSGDKFAAYSITIDDNCTPDIPFWLDISDTYGWKITWFIIVHPFMWDIYNNVTGSNTGFFGTFDTFRVLHELGHDIQLHGSCGSMNTLTAAAYEDHVVRSLDLIEARIGKRPLTFAYPCGNVLSDDGAHDYKAVMRRHLIAARGAVGGMTRVQGLDYLETLNLSVNALVDGQPAPTFARIFDDTRSFSTTGYRGWAITTHHSVSAASQLTIRETLNYVKANEHLFWVDTFTAVAKYAQERESSTLEVTAVGPDRLEFDLRDRMDDETFDFPLTVKLRVDGRWASATATQAGATTPVSLVLQGAETYLLVQAVPDRGPVVVSRGSN